MQPTWVPFGSTVAHRRRLRFALDAYDRECRSPGTLQQPGVAAGTHGRLSPGSWSSRLPLPAVVLGELINIQASVAADTRLPLRVFVDECMASPNAASPVSYQLIGNGG